MGRVVDVQPVRQNAGMTSTPFSARGAVDLGALASQRQSEHKAAAAVASAPPGVIIDVTEATFEAEAIQRSMTVPVVIDLWAEWCGPCKQLSPALEAVVASFGGRMVLAKIDVDANPRISAAFQVQSIPSVFAVIKGQVVPLFQGALPEAQVRQVLTQLLEVAAQEGVAGNVAGVEGEAVDGPAEAPVDPRFEAVYAAIEAGDWDSAEQAYRAMLASNPADADAQAGLIMVGLYRRAEGIDEAAVTAAGSDASNLAGQLAAADLDAMAGQWAAVFRRLVDTVRATSGDDREAARARLLEFFVLAGDDPAVPPARIALANALF